MSSNTFLLIADSFYESNNFKLILKSIALYYDVLSRIDLLHINNFVIVNLGMKGIILNLTLFRCKCIVIKEHIC